MVRGLTVWYDGTVVICDHPNRGGSTGAENLRKGNKDTVGRWGKNAQRTFVSRCAYMMENFMHPCWTLCLTYREEPDHK